MLPVEISRTKRARATKAFEEVGFGPLVLYFCNFELIGFGIDGTPPFVCFPSKVLGVDSGVFADLNRQYLEPDKAKWLSKCEFEMKWEEISEQIFK